MVSMRLRNTNQCWQNNTYSETAAQPKKSIAIKFLYAHICRLICMVESEQRVGSEYNNNENKSNCLECYKHIHKQCVLVDFLLGLLLKFNWNSFRLHILSNISYKCTCLLHCSIWPVDGMLFFLFLYSSHISLVPSKYLYKFSSANIFHVQNHL